MQHIRRMPNYVGLCWWLVMGACHDWEPYEPGGVESQQGPMGEQGDSPPPELPPINTFLETTTATATPPLRLIVDQLRFTQEDPKGVTVGFDLDGIQSVGEDAASCFQKDFSAPDGTGGIDNQFAILAPLFDLFGFGALEGLIQTAIEEGGLLLIWEIEAVSSADGKPLLAADGPVKITIRQGQGVPLLGTDGKLLAGQTFRIHPESADVPVSEAYVQDGWLHIGPFGVVVPVVVFGVLYEVPIVDAFARARVVEGGQLADGVLGGGVPIVDLLRIAQIADGEQGGIFETVKTMLSGMGDLMADEFGQCQRLSAALQFSAVQVFLYQDGKESL